MPDKINYEAAVAELEAIRQAAVDKDLGLIREKRIPLYLPDGYVRIEGQILQDLLQIHDHLLRELLTYPLPKGQKAF